MDTMYERIIDLCSKKGVTSGAMCDAIGIRRAFMSELKSGRTKKLSADNTAKIAEYLGTTTDYLITGMNSRKNAQFEEMLKSAQSISPEKQKLLEAVDGMSKDELVRLLKIIEAMK